MTDWAIWPLFVMQLIAVGLLFFRRDTAWFGVKIRTIIMMILLVLCLAIVLSLYHDSTDVLHLYF